MTHLSCAIYLLSIFNRTIAMDDMSKVIESPALATKGLISLIKNKKDNPYTAYDLKFIQQKIKNNADVNHPFILNMKPVSQEITPLEAAILYDQGDLASILIQAGANTVDYKTTLDDMSKVIEPPNLATKGLISLIADKKDILYTSHDVALIQQKIKNGADVNCIFQLDGQELRPIELAVKYNQNFLVALLINAGAYVEVPLEDVEPEYCYKAIDYCKDNIPLFADLLAARTSVNTKNLEGDPLLHGVLLSNDSDETLKQKICWLIFHNANPEQQNDEGDTAFDIANDESFFADQETRQNLEELLRARHPQYNQFFQDQAQKISAFKLVKNRILAEPLSEKELDSLELLMKARKPETN